MHVPDSTGTYNIIALLNTWVSDVIQRPKYLASYEHDFGQNNPKRSVGLFLVGAITCSSRAAREVVVVSSR